MSLGETIPQSPPRRRLWGAVVTALGAVFVIIVPKCPACLAAYLGVLSGVVTGGVWLWGLPLLGFLIAGAYAWRRRRRRSSSRPCCGGRAKR